MNDQSIQRVEPLEPAQQMGAMQVVDTGSLMTALANAASNPAVDVEKMERVWMMYERMDNRRAAQEYAVAMAAAQSEMPLVNRDRYNEQTGSWYATLDAINEAIVPIYTKHGLSMAFDTTDSPYPDHVRVVCRVSHVGGHVQTFTHDNPLDGTGIAGKVNKTATHARGSAITYARRYLTNLIFNLHTGFDDDGNGANAPVGGQPEPTQEQLNEQRAAQRKAQHDEALARHSESVAYIKDRIAADDLKPAADEWAAIPQPDQMALWLATTKGGVFTTDERKTIKDKFGQFNAPSANHEEQKA